MDTELQSIQPILNELIQTSLNENQEHKVEHLWSKIQITDLIYTEQSQINQFNGIQFGRGDQIAVIGQSGSGKSTLLNLLSGIYQSNRAVMHVDKQIFYNLDLMQSIATLIPQEPEIFKNTVKYNITLGAELELTKIYYYLELVDLLEVIQKLPEKLDTNLSEQGVNLSVGQKQRLALAR